MYFHDNLRGTVQVAAARVIAEAAPVRQHVIYAGGGQRCDIGKGCDEALVIGENGGYLGLLQHDLGQPHPVCIGTLPRQAVTAMYFLPADDARGKVTHQAI
jgi:hypothetical protein